MNMNVFTFYQDHKLKVWILILAGIPAVLALGAVVFPQLFWRSFLWKYFWGPLVADAEGHPVNGVEAGYNVVNTLGYGAAIVVAFRGISELVDYLDVKVDRSFIFSLLPWIILGGSLRSLEDVSLFPAKVAPIFISPLIYFLLGFSAISLMIIGSYLDKERLGSEIEIIRGILLFSPLILFLALGLTHSWEFLPILAISSAIFFVWGIKEEWLDEKYLFLSIGSSLLALSLAYNVYFIVVGPNTNPLEVVIIPLMTIIATEVLAGTIKGYSVLKKKEIVERLLTPLNALLVFSHLFDASATVRGLQNYGYVEKHVLPRFLIDLTGTPLVMFPAKMLLVIMIIYVLDFLYKEELAGMLRRKNLIKFVVIVLGTAPAVRNTMRLAMGV